MRTWPKSFSRQLVGWNTITHRLTEWLREFLLGFRLPLLLIGIAATLVAWPIARSLELDQSIAAFFAPDDPVLVAWQDSQRWFGDDEFLLVAYKLQTGRISGAEHLNELRQFVRQLNEVPGIDPAGTQSLDSLLRPEFGDSPLDRIAARAYTRVNRDAIMAFGEHLVVSEDRTSTSIVLRLEPQDEARIPRSRTFDEIRRLAAEHDPPAFVAGEPIQVNDMFRYVESDSRTLGVWSTGLLLAMILILFRNIRWVLLPLVVVHATLTWTRAILVWSDVRLSMVSTMMTSLVTIVGIATVTHVAVAYRDLRSDRDPLDAVRETLRLMMPPIFWTGVTTAIGFGALLSSRVLPVRSFGIMLALASLLVLVACAVFLPGGILVGRLDGTPRRSPLQGPLVRGLLTMSSVIERRPRAWLAGLLMIAAITGVGLLRLRVETDFSRNFRHGSPIRNAIHFFENEMGGVGLWEIHFSFGKPHAELGDSPTSAQLRDAQMAELADEATLQQTRDLAERLRNLKLADGTTLTKVVTLTEGIDFAPGSRLATKLDRLHSIQPDFTPALFNAKSGKMRMVLRSEEQQPAETKLQLIDQVTAAARDTFPDARATGLYLLLAKLISSLLDDQLRSFLVASVGILLCIAIAFRSIRIGLIALVPNVFPLLLVIGGMGWTGLPVNLGTAMIASVSMGLTVDSSIHYISGFLRARQAGADYGEAVRQTHQSVGVAVVFSNLILIGGFLVLLLSNFMPLVYFGGLVSLSMVGGLLGSLVLLPLLLRWAPTDVDNSQGPGVPPLESDPVPS
ncbi:MAG: MMPL family transporter [Planctomycetaceae bacterium]